MDEEIRKLLKEVMVVFRSSLIVLGEILRMIEEEEYGSDDNENFNSSIVLCPKHNTIMIDGECPLCRVNL